MKIAVIGAGSSYTPEILEKIAELRDKLPVQTLSLMDTNEEMVGIVGGFCRRYADHMNLPIQIEMTTLLKEALTGADFVIVQIRVGGNAARIYDEKIPLSFGLVGQETTGAGGFMKALRTVPVMVELARAVETYCPDAWIINYTNPTGIITEAVTKHTRAKIAGLCAGGMNPRRWTAQALQVDESGVRYDMVGLNHLCFGYNITVHGKLLSDEQFCRVAKYRGEEDYELCVRQRTLPSPYLQYYYHTANRLEKLKKQELCRAEQVILVEKDIHKDYRDPACNTKPESLAKRGGGGYSDIAFGFIMAVYQDRDTWLVVNAPNQNTFDWLPYDAVIETACVVNASGIHPIQASPPPVEVCGLIAAVKTYERLTVEAALTGDMAKAEMALLAHPLVGDWDVIREMLPKLMEANRRYLPNFSTNTAV